MPSTTDGHGLPSIATPDNQKMRSEKSKKTSKDVWRSHDAHVEVAGSSQTLKPIRTNVGGKPQSVHHRASRSSVSAGDTDLSRNWNSEGGRPKREKSPSERLLRRSLNSVGELIPFQRAPRDGSYESRLPLGKRVAARRSAKSNFGDVCRESFTCEQRLAARLQERPDRYEERMTKPVTDSPTGKDKRQHVASKFTYNRNRISVPKKQNTRDGNKLTEVPTWSKSKGAWKSDPSKTLALSNRKDVHAHTVDVCATTDNASPRILQQVEGKSVHTTQSLQEHESKENVASPERSDTADIQTPNFSPRSSDEALFICPPFSEEELTFSQNTRVPSPSAEFKAAAQLHTSTSAHSYSVSPTLNASTPSSTTSGNITENQTTESSESITARQDQLHRSAGQPNSVIRRLNSSGSVDTSQIQSSRGSSRHRQSETRSQNRSQAVPTSSEIPPVEGDCTPSDTDLSAADSSTQTITSAGDDPISERHPAQPSTNTNLQAHDSPDTPTQQVRPNRFGRRIRLPSGDLLRPGEHEQARQDDDIGSELVGEERSEETIGQRRGFFASSRNTGNRMQTDHEALPLTPNRNLLYGRYSPPAVRRHHRAHFGGTHAPSVYRQSSEENGSLVGESNNSTFNDNELNLAPDSFRNASGSAVVISPILQTGPDSSTSFRTPSRRRHPIESISPREPFEESSSDDNLDREILTFSVEEGRVDRDSTRRHQTDRSEAISRLLPQRSRQSSRRLPRQVETTEGVFGSTQDRSPVPRGSDEDPFESAVMDLQVLLLDSPLFAPNLGISPAMLLGLLIRTRREFGQEFMELLLENMMLNALAYHLFEGSSRDENGLSGAPPPATQDIIDNLKEIPALERHIAQEMKCAICHCEYELYEMLAELPCFHFFHPTCVANWLKKSGTCPVCRFQLLSPTT